MDTVIIFLAEYFYIVVACLALIVILLGYRHRLIELAVAVAFMGGCAYLLSLVATRLINSPRPFTLTGAKAALIPSATDNGFPSDHTLLLAVIAATLTIANRRLGLLFWGLTLIVGLSRVYAGVHNLVDVAGGFGIALIALALYLSAKALIKPRLTEARARLIFEPESLKK